MVSKLWHALESPRELVKNTDAMTPTYRLGLSRSGWGPRYMYFFLTSSQVTVMPSRFENLWRSSHHDPPFEKPTNQPTNQTNKSNQANGVNGCPLPTPLFQCSRLGVIMHPFTLQTHLPPRLSMAPTLNPDCLCLPTCALHCFAS